MASTPVAASSFSGLGMGVGGRGNSRWGPQAGLLRSVGQDRKGPGEVRRLDPTSGQPGTVHTVSGWEDIY